MTSQENLWQCLGPHACELGESPFWHPLEQMLYWVDIPGKQILRANVYMGSVETWDLPSEPGCMAPAARGGLVMALRNGVFRASQWRGPLELLTTLDYDPAAMRANDGKCDALGRFWIGSIDETKTRRNAALYCLDGRAAGAPVVQRKLGPDALAVTTANGLAWSPDGRTLYWADTPSHMVRAWDFNVASASLSAQRDFAQFPPKPAHWQVGDTAYRGRPDGAAVDIQGNYYAAMYEGQRICKFAPDGRLLAEYPTPAQCPTMPCFGGEDLQTLFVTTARHGRSAAELAAYPDSGCVFSMRLEVPGLPVNQYAD